MRTTTARVSTQSPARYGKQLCAHFGHKIPAEFADDHGRIEFGRGVVTLEAQPGVLVMVAEAQTDEDLASVAEVAGSHLVRFGQRNELTVTWASEGGAEGGTRTPTPEGDGT